MCLPPEGPRWATGCTLQAQASWVLPCALGLLPRSQPALPPPWLMRGHHPLTHPLVMTAGTVVALKDPASGPRLPPAVLTGPALGGHHRAVTMRPSHSRALLLAVLGAGGAHLSTPLQSVAAVTCSGTALPSTRRAAGSPCPA